MVQSEQAAIFEKLPHSSKCTKKSLEKWHFANDHL